MLLFVEYPKCSTCRKARKWLEASGAVFTSRHILEATPTAAELTEWSGCAGVPLLALFNTHGNLYRQMGLKDKLPGMSDAELAELLASDGMLIKRPLLVGPDVLLAGFKDGEWEQAVGAAQ